MKLISWNVNGIRACITKGFEDRFKELDADVFCLQETKLPAGTGGAGASGVSSVLELCEQQRVFRHSCIYKERAIVGSIWNRDRRARQRRPCDHT